MPVSHSFSYPLFMVYLDLSELPDVFDGRFLWSARRPALAWFRRRDYLGDPRVPLVEAVRDAAARLVGRRPRGPIRVLTHLRYLGYVMNPVTFYYCFAEGGNGVETILAEVTNTPWGERHTYAVPPGPDGLATGYDHHLTKRFHVSPFMPMRQSYVWRFEEPGERVEVHMESFEPQPAWPGEHRPGPESPAATSASKVFDATLLLQRKAMSARNMARALLRHPWMTARVAVAIYWQAALLRLKGADFYVHPSKRTA